MCAVCDNLEGVMYVAKRLELYIILCRLRTLFTEFQQAVQDSPKDAMLASLPRSKPISI